MSINGNQNPSFKSTPFIDAMLYAGVEYEPQLKGTALQGEAAQKALEQLKASYERHKDTLKLKSGEYLHNVEVSLNQFKDPAIPSTARRAVALKLSTLAHKRMTKESNFSAIHKFFHKIGQLFKGHGFRTKGEWGLELASKIEKIDAEIYKIELQSIIFQGIGLERKATENRLQAIKNKINDLSDPQFSELLDEIIFASRETSTFGKKNKLIFYENLNDDKRKIFDQKLLARGDWYQQAFDMVEGFHEKKEILQFFSPAMVDKIKADPEAVIEIFKNTNHKNGWFNKFFEVAVEAAIASHFRESEPAYGSIADLTVLLPADVIKTIFSSSQILTPEEKTKIRSNVKIWHLDF